MPKNPVRRIVMLAAGAAGIAALETASAQVPNEKPTDVSVLGHVYKPEAAKPDEEFLKTLDLPDGLEISIFDQNLSNTRMLAIGDQSGKRVYVTRRDQGDCLLLKDEDGDGKADGEPVTVAKGENMHGIAIHSNRAYLVTVRDVFTADIKDDGTFSELRKIISDLPDGGQHPNRTIAVGPDEKLYITVGSTCNACKETNNEAATILKADLDGTTRTIFATGLRNTIGFGWHPQSGKMWGMDHGVDWLGNDSQKEELNLLEEGNFYGWPFILGEGMRNPQDEPPPGQTFEELEGRTTLPALTYKAHSSPLQMAFLPDGPWPAEYAGDALVAMRGSWNRKPPSGYEVVRVDFDESGNPVKMEPLISGFLRHEEGANWKQYGRLAGLAIAPDGSAMFLADDHNGVIYRISHKK